MLSTMIKKNFFLDNFKESLLYIHPLYFFLYFFSINVQGCLKCSALDNKYVFKLEKMDHEELR